MVVDDLHLSAVPGTTTATPTVTATAPASPSTSLTPTVTGTAEAGSTVTLFSNSTCTSAALGSGSVAQLTGAGITATVPAGATTTIYATAATADKNDSACSATFATYTHLGPPETTLTKTPKKRVLTKKRKDSVVFAFSSATAGARFECSVDGAAYRPCTSGQKLKLDVGKHVFVVRASANGLVDPTPARYGFKIQRRH
jgi:hypothetical protein